MAAKKTILKKLPGKKKPPTLTLKTVPAAEPGKVGATKMPGRNKATDVTLKRGAISTPVKKKSS